MRKVIGLIAGAFKPMTQGHWFLVEKASKECDVVYLYVSNKDRIRKGELPITWEQMKPVWERYLLKVMPSNVKVRFVDLPIKYVMDTLIEADADVNNNNTYIIYSDPEDMSKNYNERAQKKYMSRLLANDQVMFRTVDRSSSTEKPVSGTLLRKYLQNGNVKLFIAGLPKPIRVYGLDIYHLLGGAR